MFVRLVQKLHNHAYDAMLQTQADHAIKALFKVQLECCISSDCLRQFEAYVCGRHIAPLFVRMRATGKMDRVPSLRSYRLPIPQRRNAVVRSRWRKVGASAGQWLVVAGAVVAMGGQCF